MHVIHEATPLDITHPDDKSMGLIPRNYGIYPRGCYASVKAIDFPIIPIDTLREVIKDKEATKARLSDIRNIGNAGSRIKSLNQGQWGYCWMHSGTNANKIVRAIAGLPYVALSAFAPAATIKNGRNEGGWGAQGLDFLFDKGQPSEQYWPEQDANLSHGTLECWENAKGHRVTEGFVDLAVAQYNRKFSWDQQCTVLASGIPEIGDYNWWGHSVCGLDLVDGQAQRQTFRVESGKLPSLQEFDLIWGMNNAVTGGIGKRIWNSWGDEWGEVGTSVLTGSRAISDSSTAPRVSTPSLQ